MEQTELKEHDVIENCDAIVFASFQNPEDEIETSMTFFKTDHDAEPTEMGHRFSILTFRKTCPEDDEIDLFTAILGDPKGYVERLGKMGYHGILVKKGVAKDGGDLMKVFEKVLTVWGFKDTLIQKVFAEAKV